MKSDAERVADRFLILLITVDVILIVLHILHTYTTLIPEWCSILFSITMDWAYGEMFQYIKELWVVMLLLFLARGKSRFLYVSWSLLFLYLMVDDFLGIHERLGIFIADHFDFHSRCGLRPQDFGELIVLTLFVTPCLAIVGAAHYLSGTAARKISKHLFAMLALLVLFGVVVDMLPTVVKHGHPVLSPMVGVVEDGGEMLVMSFICRFLFALLAKDIYLTEKVHVNCP